MQIEIKKDKLISLYHEYKKEPGWIFKIEKEKKLSQEEVAFLEEYDDYMNLIFKSEEDAWRKKLREQYNPRTLVEAFPESQPIIETNQEKYKNELIKTRKSFIEFLRSLRENTQEKNHWFIDQVAKEEFLPILRQIYQRLTEYKTLMYFHRLRKHPESIQKGSITKDDIQRAKQYPLEKLYKGDLRENNKTFCGLCPFHSENTPSFHIYKETNTFHCFGCKASGDVITFIRKLHNLNFIQTIKFLTKI